MKKLTGSFYTPKILSDFIVEYVLKVAKAKKNLSILEPSVGDGVFLESLIQNKRHADFKRIRITALDINEKELSKAKGRISRLRCLNEHNFIKKDFLNFQLNPKEQYSIILGNPPYIKGGLLTKNQLETCSCIHKEASLSSRRIKNIWTSFVIHSAKMLTHDGILAFVLPADILQVKYAEEIRRFLEVEFERIEIFTLAKSTFEGTEQQTIVLFAFKKARNKGTFFYNIIDIENYKYKQISSNGLMINEKKWTHYNLTPLEIRLLNQLNSKLPRVSDFLDSAPGIVTGANSFFILPKATIEEYDLHRYSLPIIQKCVYVKGCIDFSKGDYEELVQRGCPTHLLALTGNEKQHKKLKLFLKFGTELGINKRYKCSRREKWYVIPSISTPPEAFFFRRSHVLPKIVRNKARVLATDSAYKIKMKDDYSVESLIYSFYNVITLIFSELTGRKYGGGVLELTPSEFKNLPIPYEHITTKKFDEFRKLSVDTETFTNSLLSDDKIEQLQGVRINKVQTDMLKSIYKKLVSSRVE